MRSVRIREPLIMTVAGEQFPNADGSSRQVEIGQCRVGELVHLRREPDNPADPMAVAVYSARKVQVGYLRRADAMWISPIINAGGEVTAEVVSVAPKGRPFSPLALTLRVTVLD